MDCVQENELKANEAPCKKRRNNAPEAEMVLASDLWREMCQAAQVCYWGMVAFSVQKSAILLILLLSVVS